NLYKLPVVLAFGRDVTPQHVRQFTGPAELWDEATEARPLERPPQGFRANSPDEPALAGREGSRWCASELYERCCVIGRASRVKRLTTRGRFAVEGKNRSVSRLLWVEVGWRMPMQGESTAQVVVGHLHNSEAKRECDARNRYFERLAQFCAGGARLLGMDLNMAIFGLVEELGRRGVGCTLVSHHYEWRYDETLYDSLGLWVVGPMDVARSTILTAETLALAGAYHAILLDETPQAARGFPPRSHAWPVPALCRRVDVGPLSSQITRADSEFVTRHADAPGMEDSLGVRPWADVRLHP
ncbi:MAG: hypothetical protein GY772_08135, partial [bacterium]|nr:hypothetical protein [bacterium]